MRVSNYRLTDSVAGFEEGDVLDVTARFGDWHAYSLKLEQSPSSPTSRTVVVTDSEAGFSESDVLDETARIGDWHEYDLKFDPESRHESHSGRVVLSMDELKTVAEPVDTSA
ncbi:hypothetical protein GRX03_01820 [Halovenus sp. WSH3]|uniref:Uncharacterized protein n=1 Tax=Halovenus carboxidivorans TaxID=2692199 RepID=A0A6B0SXB5_9EURY|nr:hypothetical protein [Halovenus carboxidivorans]MXR50348.1 hypothetical protein [Halovenus carboxidivorans]